MEIQSAFNTGIQGFNNAQQDANEAALAIASETTYNAEDPTQGQAVNDSVVAQNTTSGDLSKLNQEIVKLRVAEHQAAASGEVIKTADETLGTLLDVRV
ncbi:hypothetical protein [Thalassotalea agariperforans]